MFVLPRGINHLLAIKPFSIFQPFSTQIGTPMKTVFLLLFLAFIGLVGHAQALTGAAATYDKSFWTAINKANGLDFTINRTTYENTITQATTNLKQLRKVAPDLKVEKHEAALEAAKARMESQADAMGLEIDLENMNKRMAEIKQMRQVPVAYQEDIAMRIQREVASFKQNHPTYDASQFQKESDDFVAYLANKNKNEDQARNDANDFRAEYDKAFSGLRSFDGNVQTGNEDAGRIKNQEQLTKLEAQVTQFLATDLAKKAESLHSAYIDNNILAALTKQAANNDTQINENKKRVMEAYKKEDNWAGYDNLRALAIFWEGNSKLFPSHAEYKTALINTQNAIADCGSMENMEEMRKKNHAKYLTTVTMKPAEVHDAAIEAEMKKTYLACEYGKGANVIKVNLTTNQWTLLHDELTGAVTSRGIGFATIVYKDAQGNCWTDTFGILQAKVGNGWGPSSKYYKYDQKAQILCENVR